MSPLRRLRRWLKGSADDVPRSSASSRVLFQPYARTGACGILDDGFRSGYRELGAQVLDWDPAAERPSLERILSRFAPTHFIGYLQTPQRKPAPWCQDAFLNPLLRYRERRGLQTAICSFPSNLRSVYGPWMKTVESLRDPIVFSYYNQGDRPNEVEARVFDAGFVDLVTTRYCADEIPRLYANFLRRGLPILVQPPAGASLPPADDAPMGQMQAANEILYVGNCWPFKWDNMKRYVEPLKNRFGARFKVYGKGWPEGLSEGPLEPMEETVFANAARGAAINIGLHEPSQVLNFATSTNERVFKLIRMGCFVLSDPCGAIRRYFNPGEHLAMAEDGRVMVRMAEYYLERPEERARIAALGKCWAEARHTYRTRAERALKLLDHVTPGVHDYAPPVEHLA